MHLHLLITISFDVSIVLVILSPHNLRTLYIIRSHHMLVQTVHMVHRMVVRTLHSWLTN